MAIIDPADIHYYQPGWTLVGGGVFDPGETVRTMASVVPKGVHWLKAAVAAFEPKENAVVLDGCRVVKYDRLVVCPGLKLDWDAIPGLVQTLGKNGVTSNYRFDLAPYTWELVRGLTSGTALFTQPPMPIKCAGAPQKAMYLSADHWQRQGRLSDIDNRLLQRRRRAVRRQGVRAAADDLRRALRHRPAVQAQPERHRRPRRARPGSPAATRTARPRRSSAAST